MTRTEILKRAFSEEFVEGMRVRMVTGVFKYGFPDETVKRVDRWETIKARWQKYVETGNTEYMMDIANFVMVEFMFPKHQKAHFTPTDSDGSPGLQDSSGRALHTRPETTGERYVG